MKLLIYFIACFYKGKHIRQYPMPGILKSWVESFLKMFQLNPGDVFKSDFGFCSIEHGVFWFLRWSIRRIWKVVKVTVSTTVRHLNSGA
jgi:hypothetical protein